MCLLTSLLLKPFKPYSALLVTPYYALHRNNSLCALCLQVLHQEKGWDRGRVGGVTHRVTCTWWVLGFADKVPCMVGTG